MKKNICILFLLLIIPVNAKAIHEVIDSRCTNSLKLSLRDEAKSAVYRISRSDSGLYNIYFYNISEDIDIVGLNDNKYDSMQINDLRPGSTLKINLVASSSSYCSGYKILSKTIKIPYYNPYYGSDLCKGYENLSICAENTNVSLDEKNFVKEIEKHKNDLSDLEENEIDEMPDQNQENGIYEFALQYWYYVVYVILFVGITVCVIKIIINRRKNDIL